VLFILNLNAVKDNITLQVRILSTSMQPVYGKHHIKNLELIVMDEHNTRMQATVRMGFLNQFKDWLKEGSSIILEGYMEPCNDFIGSLHGFDFRGYKSITDLKQEEDGQFDVIGHVIACEDLDNYDKNGKSGKKKPLTLVDHEYKTIESLHKIMNTKGSLHPSKIRLLNNAAQETLE
ncbi:replication protein A 70 kDa DNA-binding subunit B, partial [Tanacetum coccineum]